MIFAVCPRCDPDSIPSYSRVFKGIFPWLIILCQPVPSQRGKKWLNLPSMASNNLWKSRRKAEVQPTAENGGDEKISNTRPKTCNGLICFYSMSQERRKNVVVVYKLNKATQQISKISIPYSCISRILSQSITILWLTAD